MGQEAGFEATHVAALLEDPLRLSTPMAESPHVRLLYEYAKRGEAIFAPEDFRRTAYFANASAVMRTFGNYFEATREAEIVAVAERFVQEWPGGSPGDDPSGHSRKGDPILVRRIAHSNCFSVVDGHHRLAHAFARGESEAHIVIREPPLTTPLQDAVLKTSWNVRPFEVYQPVPLPEVQTHPWRVVRRCDDRLTMMTNFLASLHVSGEARRYLDIASSYGYFVHEMRSLGFDAHGVERDPHSREVGILVWGLDEETVHLAEAVTFLKEVVEVGERFDVVSCLSLLHHFALNKDGLSPESFIGLVDNVTESVLFLDTGEATEEWYADTLPEWTPDYIELWLKEHTSFREVVRLGRDADGVGAFKGNYGRTLFACSR